tara:strand:+ start:1036 stop:2064 length:1029 start_codon:yes stop_codon:yes gene_type:complete
MASRHIVNRGLPERSKLQFFFPNPIEAEEYFVVALPFFENPRISERKKARYQSYQTISRSSNMYSYLGADSRQFTVEFNMTLDHILDSGDIYIEKYAPILRGEYNQDSAKASFFRKHTSNTSESPAARLATQYKNLSNVRDSAQQVLNSDIMQRGGNSLHSTRQYIQNKYNVGSDFFDSLKPNSPQTMEMTRASDNAVDQVITDIANPGADAEVASSPIVKAIDVIIYWVNIIRSSVINSASNPLYGPPIVRLSHGILYEDVPCICKDYSLSYNESAGFNIDTLLPRQIKVTMKLEENRTGDFGEFNGESQNTRTRDNLAGWEAVVTKPTRSGDPGSGGRIA